MANQCSICMYMAHTQILVHSWGLEQGFKCCFTDGLNQGLVVQMMDGAIHWINHYPADKY